MLKITNVKFTYDNNRNVYHDINLQINGGNIYGLLGKNGSGKSTLLKLAAGTIFADRGMITLFDKDVAKRSKETLQETFLLTEDIGKSTLSAQQYLKVYSRFYPYFDHDKFLSVLEEWQVPIQEKLSNYSHGSYKKFLIAFALATNCKLILLDEPTNGLDIPSKTIFKKLIAGSVNEKSSLVISSHQLHDLDGLIDPLIIVDQGKILFNQNLKSIEDKLIFSVGSIPNDYSVLYSMPTPGGMAYIARRSEEIPYGTKVDLELLFNAVINNTEMITNIFGNSH